MWIKSYKGKLYNSNHLVLIEFDATGTGEWDITAKVMGATQQTVTLAKFTEEAKGRAVFETIETRLETSEGLIEMTPFASRIDTD